MMSNKQPEGSVMLEDDVRHFMADNESKRTRIGAKAAVNNLVGEEDYILFPIFDRGGIEDVRFDNVNFGQLADAEPLAKTFNASMDLGKLIGGDIDARAVQHGHRFT